MRFITSALLRGEASRALALHRYVMRSAASLTSGFIWVLIFAYFAFSVSIGEALVRTLMLYALTQSIALLLLPFAMRRMRGGMLRGVVYGTIIFATALTYIGALIGGVFPEGSACIGVLLGAYAALYRVPYTVEHAAARPAQNKSLSGEALLAVIPLIAGFLLASTLEPQLLFFGAALLVIISLVPLLFVPNVHEDFSWGYRETFGHFAALENRQLLYSSLWRGAIGALLVFVWPLVLIFFTHSLLMLGALYSATLVALLLFKASRSTFVVVNHADGGAYLDEFTALKEMGISLGRFLIAVLCAFTVALLTL